MLQLPSHDSTETTIEDEYKSVYIGFVFFVLLLADHNKGAAQNLGPIGMSNL